MRSRAAAQLLEGQGFKKVYNLKGGMNAWDGEAAVGPPNLGLVAFSEAAGPIELTKRAFAMEKGLRQYYLVMADRIEDHDAAGLFKQLAGYEDRHMDRIYVLYQSLGPEAMERADFENDAVSPYLEGGMDAETFLAAQPNPESVTATLELAQSIEVQALDLYLRFARQLAEKEERAIVYSLAEDEKVHLARLAELMGGKV